MIPSSLLLLKQRTPKPTSSSSTTSISSAIIISSIVANCVRGVVTTSTIDDDLLLNENAHQSNSKNMNSKNIQKPMAHSPLMGKKPPLPPSAGGMVRPKLMMKPITSSSTTTGVKGPHQSATTTTVSSSASSLQQQQQQQQQHQKRIALKSVNTGVSNKTTVIQQIEKDKLERQLLQTQQQQQQQEEHQQKIKSSSTKIHVMSTAQIVEQTLSGSHQQQQQQKEVVEQNENEDDEETTSSATTTHHHQTQTGETDLEDLVESCELIVPAQGGMSLSELFAILSAEDRLLIKKSSHKLLSKFLRAYPDHFAVSPNNIVVVLVSAYDGDHTTAANYARVAEALLPSSLDYVSSTGIVTKSFGKDSASKSGSNNKQAHQQGDLFTPDESLLLLQPVSTETMELLKKNCNPFFFSEYKPVTAADEVLRYEQMVVHSGDHHRLVLDKVPPADLVKIDTATQTDGRIRTPSEFKNSVDEIFSNVLSTQTLVRVMPTWFVPAPDVVALMGEGYTEDHFDQFFGDSSAVEVVTLAGKKFVRLHGGSRHKALVDFDNAEARDAEKMFEKYRPDPRLVIDILRHLPPRGQWVSLFELWNRLPPDVQERFPFPGPHSLTYFAQMQHIFSFSPNDGGGVCIPVGLPGHLQWDTTPFVKQLHAIFTEMLNGKMTFVADLLSAHFPKISPSRKLLREPFLRGLILARAVHGSGIDPNFAFTCDVESLDASQIEDLMRVFVSLHQNIFAYREESMLTDAQQMEFDRQEGGGGERGAGRSGSGVDEIITPESIQNKHGRSVCLRFEFEAMERHKLDIPQQIEIAMQRGNNKMVKKLKRKMLLLQQPDNPYLEEENLAKAISEFLPPDRSISWPRLKKNLPQEIVDLLPVAGKKFMTKWPQYFKKFDVGVLHNHSVHLQLPHLLPPPGAFRAAGEYSDEELLSAMGQVLLRGPKTVASLCSALPDGIYDSLRLKFGGVAQAVQRHPQYFAIVIKDVRNKDLRTAIVTLIQVPNLQTVEDNLVESERAAEENRNEISSIHKERETGFEKSGDDEFGGSSTNGGGKDIWTEVIGETVAAVAVKDGNQRITNNSKNDETGVDGADLWSKLATEGDSTLSPDDTATPTEPEGKSTMKHIDQDDQQQVNHSGW